MPVNPAVAQLNAFLRDEAAAVDTYNHAIERVRDSAARSQLIACQRAHALRIEALRRRIQRFGGIPSTNASIWGAISRLPDGGASMSGGKAAVMALQEGEERVLHNYQLNVMKLDADTRSFVERELLPAQQLTSQSLEALKTTMR
jgi:hypothetical protein